MHFNLIDWLFTDAYTAATNAGSTTPTETFHFVWAWLIFCCAGLLLSFYYSVEGRKRFFKDKPIVKYMLDRYLGWFAVVCFVGLPILFGRVFMDASFFAWRFWRYLWMAGLLTWAIFWVVYLVRKYPAEAANFKAYQNRQQYIPKSKRSAKAAAR